MDGFEAERTGALARVGARGPALGLPCRTAIESALGTQMCPSLKFPVVATCATAAAFQSRNTPIQNPLRTIPPPPSKGIVVMGATHPSPHATRHSTPQATCPSKRPLPLPRLPIPFTPPPKGIVVMGATNRKDVLDAALTRPGRFDRSIEVTRPDFKGRLECIKVRSARLCVCVCAASVVCVFRCL